MDLAAEVGHVGRHQNDHFKLAGIVSGFHGNSSGLDYKAPLGDVWAILPEACPLSYALRPLA
ncbi:hypothetical protein D9M69_709650 [compost metagenome]